MLQLVEVNKELRYTEEYCQLSSYVPIKFKYTKQELQNEKKFTDEINNIVYSKIIHPYTQLKLLLSSSNIHNVPANLLSKEEISHMRILWYLQLSISVWERKHILRLQIKFC